MEEVKNAKELLDETISILNEKKVARKALAEVNKRVVTETAGDKGDWNTLVKAYANKGRAWIGNNPLELNSEEKHKDVVSPIFNKLLNLIKAAEAFDQTEELLGEYFAALEEAGITIQINPEKFTHSNVDMMDEDIEEELKAAKSFLLTIESYSDEIKNEHAIKAEELNFAPKTGYMQVANIYKKGINGKDIDDTVQNILTYNEFIDKAVNLAADYAKDINNTGN